MFNLFKKKEEDTLPVPDLPELPPTPEPEHDDIPKDHALIEEPVKEVVSMRPFAVQNQLGIVDVDTRDFKTAIKDTNKSITSTNKRLKALRAKLGKL